MRKTHKKILGFLSLGLVVAMTIFAATLPIPGAKATSTFTDTITVRVKGYSVNVQITNPGDGAVLVYPDQDVSVNHEHTDNVTITGKYVDENGVETALDFGTHPTTNDDPVVVNVDLDNWGYGEYTIIATGEDPDGLTNTHIIKFKYVPIVAPVTEDPQTGDPSVDLEYDVDNVCSADINVYLGTKLIAPPSPIHVEAPTTHVTIPVEPLETGHYTIVTTAYDCSPDPQPLPFPYTDEFDYTEDDTPVPNTGSFFMGMNISKSDYLITAIIMFFAFAIVALWIIAKGRKNNKRR